MDRLSGEYKRYSQIVALLCGLFFAVALNVDSVRIADTLWKNEALRTQVANSASSAIQNAKGGVPSGNVAVNIQTLQALDLLTIGWPANKSDIPPGLSQELFPRACNGKGRAAGHRLANDCTPRPLLEPPSGSTPCSAS